jgi:hypothetical protein
MRSSGFLQGASRTCVSSITSLGSWGTDDDCFKRIQSYNDYLQSVWKEVLPTPRCYHGGEKQLDGSVTPRTIGNCSWEHRISGSTDNEVPDSTIFEFMSGPDGQLAPESEAAVEAIARAPEVGQRVYRVWGRSTDPDAGDGSGPYGQSWTRDDPRLSTNYRDEAGLPDENEGRFLTIGELRSIKGVEVAPNGAVPLDGNAGGADEIIIPIPQFQVTITDVIGLDPDW